MAAYTLNPQDRQRLQDLQTEIARRTENFLGYPVSKDFDYSALLPFLSYPLNNLGDPFADSTWKVATREFEREVVTFFAELLRAPANNWWGYVTNGGTEGNLYGLYLARELLPKGMVYYSQETHYSVAKNLHFLGMRSIMIRSQKSGEIDYDDLRETMRIHRDCPPIIFANIGTTMTEGRDDISAIRAIISDLALQQSYIHADCALSGMICPFIEPRPPFDFADGADSMSISGHKFLGSPIPCGVALAKKSNVDRIARGIAYIGSLDTTITGSRNGFTPLVLWQRIRELGLDGMRARVEHALATAVYACERLRALGVDAWRNPGCITVVLPSVPDAIKEKYQLATANGITHLICLPNVSTAQIDAFITDWQSAQQAAAQPAA
ncbi:histidine decarboxylase [Massilia sp. W12]|uniref:histidine decarboxylase n=1 Tax=Massilia sp. W12 TaxID=3126507 RepID=UPI0030D6043B